MWKLLLSAALKRITMKKYTRSIRQYMYLLNTCNILSTFKNISEQKANDILPGGNVLKKAVKIFY